MARALAGLSGVALAALLSGACGGDPVVEDAAPPPPPPATGAPADLPPAEPTPVPQPSPSGTARAEQWVVRYRLVVDAAGLDPAEVAATIEAVLRDPRGWVRAGFVFVPDGPDAPPTSLPVATITVAEGPEIDRRCHPYDTFGRFSCQLGATVNLNADRWRAATDEWPADLASYRTYLVNHEVGHLLGLHHPKPQCPGAGYPAPIMLQQSTELGACTANPWPLAWEVELAASRVEPFAPGYEPDPSGRPSPPPVRQ